MPTILLTGASGYIGSHTWLALNAAGYDVIGLDNFCNSSPRVLDRLATLLGRPTVFEQADVCDAAALDAVFSRHHINAVVHFTALKAVGESTTPEVAADHRNGGLVGHQPLWPDQADG